MVELVAGIVAGIADGIAVGKCFGQRVCGVSTVSMDVKIHLGMVKPIMVFD